MNGDNSSGCLLLGCDKDIAAKTALAVAEAAGARVQSRLQAYRDPTQSIGGGGGGGGGLELDVPSCGKLSGLSAVVRYIVAESVASRCAHGSSSAGDSRALPTTHMPATFQRKRVVVTEATAIDGTQGVLDGWMDIACYELLPAVDVWLSMDTTFSPTKVRSR